MSNLQKASRQSTNAVAFAEAKYEFASAIFCRDDRFQAKYVYLYKIVFVLINIFINEFTKIYNFT